MKKLCALLTVIILILSFSACVEQTSDKDDICRTPDLTLNGEKITDAEYEYFCKIVRSEIITEYAEKYSVTDFSDFWQTEFDGEIPAQELEKRATDMCIRARIELDLCKDNGIYDDVSFDGLKAKAQKFNDENENKSGVVGLKSISLNTFYTYYIETGVMELKNRLEKDELKPSDAEIQDKINSMTDDLKADLSDEEIYNYAFDNLVNEKYEELISKKISEAEVLKN